MAYYYYSLMTYETVEMEMVAFGAEDCVELLFCHSGIVKRIDKELDR